MSEQTIVVLDPTAVGRAQERPLAPRPETLEGKRIGLLWNGKSNADVFLSEVEKLLVHTYHPASTRNWSKHNASATAFESLIEELAQGCDLVVNGIGD